MRSGQRVLSCLICIKLRMKRFLSQLAFILLQDFLECLPDILPFYCDGFISMQDFKHCSAFTSLNLWEYVMFDPCIQQLFFFPSLLCELSFMLTTHDTNFLYWFRSDFCLFCFLSVIVFVTSSLNYLKSMCEVYNSSSSYRGATLLMPQGTQLHYQLDLGLYHLLRKICIFLVTQ